LFEIFLLGLNDRKWPAVLHERGKRSSQGVLRTADPWLPQTKARPGEIPGTPETTAPPSPLSTCASTRASGDYWNSNYIQRFLGRYPVVRGARIETIASVLFPFPQSCLHLRVSAKTEQWLAVSRSWFKRGSSPCLCSIHKRIPRTGRSHGEVGLCQSWVTGRE